MLTGVQFQLDGANIGGVVATAPFTLQLNTTKLTNGSHTVTAVARDTGFNSAVSAPVMFTVQN